MCGRCTAPSATTANEQPERAKASNDPYRHRSRPCCRLPRLRPAAAAPPLPSPPHLPPLPLPPLRGRRRRRSAAAGSSKGAGPRRTATTMTVSMMMRRMRRRRTATRRWGGVMRGDGTARSSRSIRITRTRLQAFLLLLLLHLRSLQRWTTRLLPRSSDRCSRPRRYRRIRGLGRASRRPARTFITSRKCLIASAARSFSAAARPCAWAHTP